MVREEDGEGYKHNNERDHGKRSCSQADGEYEAKQTFDDDDSALDNFLSALNEDENEIQKKSLSKQSTQYLENLISQGNISDFDE